MVSGLRPAPLSQPQENTSRSGATISLNSPVTTCTEPARRMHFDPVFAADARVDLAMRHGHRFGPVPALHQALLGESREHALRRRLEMSVQDERSYRHGVSFPLCVACLALRAAPRVGRSPSTRIRASRRSRPALPPAARGAANRPASAPEPCARSAAPLRAPCSAGDRGTADFERLGEFPDRRLPRREPRDDGAAGRVGEGGEGLGQRVHALYLT